MANKREYIVIEPSIVGNQEHGFECVYSWDGIRHTTHRDAVRAGWCSRGSDDFNIGVVEGVNLVDFLWMDQPMNDPEGMAECAKQNHLRLKSGARHD